MIGVAIAEETEWEATVSYFNGENLLEYPYGTYFIKDNLIFYYSDSRKVNSAAGAQYMIDKFNIEKIMVVGTCAGIDEKFKIFDVVVPYKAIQYDCTVKEVEPLTKEKFVVNIDLSKYEVNNTGIIGSADKAVVMWKDYMELKDNNFTIADMESAPVISDFPLDKNGKDAKKSSDEQIKIFYRNVPIVMEKIFKEYFEKYI